MMQMMGSQVSMYFDAAVVHICHQLDTFIQIFSGHIVIHNLKTKCKITRILLTTKMD